MSGVMTLACNSGCLPNVARVLQAAAGAVEVEPGPAVEAVFLHVGHVVGDQVVAQAVALIGGAPQLAGDGVDGFAHAVAQAAGVDLDELAVGVNSRTSARWNSSGCVSESSTLECEPTEANSLLPSFEKIRSRVQWPPPRRWPPPGSSSMLHGAAGFEIAILIGEADNAVGVADKEPLGLGPSG
jgi:hypothetical protein